MHIAYDLCAQAHEDITTVADRLQLLQRQGRQQVKQPPLTVHSPDNAQAQAAAWLSRGRRLTTPTMAYAWLMGLGSLLSGYQTNYGPIQHCRQILSWHSGVMQRLHQRNTADVASCNQVPMTSQQSCQCLLSPLSKWLAHKF